MALAFDAASTSSAGNINTTTFSHTTSGSNRILFFSAWRNSSGGTVTATYSGTSMTLLQSVTTNFSTSHLFMLVNPTTGSNTVSITLVGTTANAWEFRATSYSGAAQTGQPDGSTTATSRGPAITPTAAGCWVLSNAYDDGTTITGAGTTRIGSGGLFIVQDSNGIVPAASSYTGLSFSSSGSNPKAIIASIVPDVAPTSAVTGYRSLLGVGI